VSQFELARRALGDLQEIWEFVSQDSFSAAERVIDDFYSVSPSCGSPRYGP
jgi:plasmid stabilization system protein ParE